MTMRSHRASSKWTLVGIGALAVFCASPGIALTINHIDRGAFNVTDLVTGDFKVTAGSYQIRAINDAAIGGTGLPFELTRNYSVFDLSGLSGTITLAKFEIFADVGAYNSSAASETVNLVAVSTSPADLLLGNAGPSPGSVFPDLGTGLPYVDAPFTVTAADDNSYISVTLNANALTALNTAVGSGTWAVGGALTSIDGSFSGIWERIFKASGTSDPVTRLVLTGSVVPEPSTALMLGLGLIALARAPRVRSK